MRSNAPTNAGIREVALPESETMVTTTPSAINSPPQIEVWLALLNPVGRVDS